LLPAVTPPTSTTTYHPLLFLILFIYYFGIYWETGTQELSGTIGKVTDVAVVNREERYVTTTASLFGFFPVQRRAHYRGPV
jgi:hypothetical protein